MKLLQELREQVATLGEIRRAWFTSFNMNIEFVETFVLPVTLGVNTPRTRLEYELLQRELSDKGIEFRVFCDPRFLDTSHIKRTCIGIHGVRPSRMAERFSDASLFHPKVIYLEDKAGKRVIGAGSANLTIEGWGRNIEVFKFFEIGSSENYRSIRAFFDSVCQAAGVDEKLSARHKFTSAQEKWRFVHSMQKETFPEQMLGGANGTDLVVWSPYLPKDLAGFIRGLQHAAGIQDLHVHLVPDLLEGKFLRTLWTPALKALLKPPDSLSFHANPAPRRTSTELCHAKVWKASGKLGIGSWNFTGPGSNSLLDEQDRWHPDNNVEAGFIISDRHPWEAACGQRLGLGEQNCASAELLAREGLAVVPLPPFDLQVSFDWNKGSYEFVGRWLEEDRRSEGWSILLPGVKHSLPLRWNRRGEPAQPVVPRIDDSVLLRDRVFTVCRGADIVHRGLVIERKPEFRRAQAFASLQDLLEMLAQGDDPQSMEDLPLRIAPGTTDPDESPPTAKEESLPSDGAAAASRGGISYFKLFQSVQSYRLRLASIERLDALDRLAFSTPGCLLELVEKTQRELVTPAREIFNWFLAREVHALCKFAHSRRKSLMRGAPERHGEYEPVPKARWQELVLKLPPSPEGISAEYLRLVERQCRYG